MKRSIVLIILIALVLSGCGTAKPAPSSAPAPTTSQGTVINQTVTSDDFTMQQTPGSSCFSAIGYKGGDLIVTFRDSGASYIYYDVPRSVWNDLKSADSMGGYYNSEIKGQYTCEKLEG